MSEFESIKPPSQLEHPLFQGLVYILFVDEWKFFHHYELSEVPWEEDGSGINDLYVNWENIQSVLENQFLHFHKANLEDVKKAIALFLKIIFWSNQKPVVLNNLDGELDQLGIKPMNIKDRFKFILSRPDSFHAFKQLEELVIEQRKAYASYQVRKKHNEK